MRGSLLIQVGFFFQIGDGSETEHFVPFSVHVHKRGGGGIHWFFILRKKIIKKIFKL